jgi:hypothetical protein
LVSVVSPVLGPWRHGRERVLRCLVGDRLLRPRRARCRGCAGTHVLVPDMALLRRRDEVTVIGVAIEAKVAGEGHRPIARRLGVHADTVRGWLRRFAERAELIRAHFTRWTVALDPEIGAVLPAGSGIADALERAAGGGDLPDPRGQLRGLRVSADEPDRVPRRLGLVGFSFRSVSD